MPNNVDTEKPVAIAQIKLELIFSGTTFCNIVVKLVKEQPMY